MKWMLVVVVFGLTPVKTGLLFNSLEECLKAEDASRSAYARAYNAWLQWAQANPGESGFPNSRAAMLKRIGLENPGTCIPHADQKRSQPNPSCQAQHAQEGEHHEDLPLAITSAFSFAFPP
jgi:hypothetical protein